jgi:hypothetical protein
MGRIYQPGADDIIYHYCSSSTFKAILDGLAIRFSDIAMLNDSQESRWGYSVFEEAATRVITRIGVPEKAPIIDEAFVRKIDDILSPFQTRAHPFISCFSRSRDDLSQWRAYGDDGRGFAIGFSAKGLLEAAPVRLLDVIYNREAQIQEMMTAIWATSMAWNERPEASREREFFEDCTWLAVGMLALKHPSFASEQEVRALHLIDVVAEGQGLKFGDSKGFDGKPVQPVRFLVRDNHLVAYFDMPLVRDGQGCCIKEVVLGPKNHMHYGNIFLYLAGLGFPDIKLRRSSGTYR